MRIPTLAIFVVLISVTTALAATAVGNDGSSASQYSDDSKLRQNIPAERWRGKRVRVTPHLKTDGAASAVPWLRVDKTNGVAISVGLHSLFPDNKDWQDRPFVVNVPDNASQIALGLRVYGRGKVWIDGVTIEPVTADVPASPSRRIETFIDGEHEIQPLEFPAMVGEFAPSSAH